MKKLQIVLTVLLFLLIGLSFTGCSDEDLDSINSKRTYYIKVEAKIEVVDYRISTGREIRTERTTRTIIEKHNANIQEKNDIEGRYRGVEDVVEKVYPGDFGVRTTSRYKVTVSPNS